MSDVDLRKAAADVVLASVLSPGLPIEMVPSERMEALRLMLDHDDLIAAAGRRRAENLQKT